MTKQHVFKYLHTEDHESDEEVEYTFYYLFIPGTPPTWERKKTEDRVVIQKITFMEDGKEVIVDDEDDIAWLRHRVNLVDMLIAAKLAIAEKWNNFTPPDDTPCLERPWWETR